MDHVFALLEEYANTLEKEVEERTRELAEEKLKSDLLLYRMLPRSEFIYLCINQCNQPGIFIQYKQCFLVIIYSYAKCK